MSSLPNNSSNPLLDTFLIEALMERLQSRNPVNNPLVSQSLEDYLYGDFEDEEDEREINPFEEGAAELSRQERLLEREIIRIVVGGRGDSLLPNSGQAVSVLEHSICVGCQEDDDGDYMVWEWHGHIMAYSEQWGYSPEYIYGSYFQRLTRSTRPTAASGEGKEEEEKGNQGLKDLIDETKDSSAGRILHRNLNTRSPPRQEMMQ